MNKQSPTITSKSFARWKVLRLAITSRILLLISMVLSSSVIPTFNNADDDVLTFDLRLDYYNSQSNKSSFTTSKRITIPCFCLEGHFCDHNAFEIYEKEQDGIISQHQQLIHQLLTKKQSNDEANTDFNEKKGRNQPEKHKVVRYDPLEKSNKCAKKKKNGQYYYERQNKDGKRSLMRRTKLDRIYNVILTPFTRWDAARFLSLAVDHMARIPDPDKIFTTTTAAATTTTRNIMKEEKSTTTCSSSCTSSTSDASIDYASFTSELKDTQTQFRRSEQSHAFFPLFPSMMRTTAYIMYQIIPHSFLPSTFEGIVVLTGLLLNMVFFIMTSIILFELTFEILKLQRSKTMTIDAAVTKTTTSSSTSSTISTNNDTAIINKAYLTSKIFCLNPANIFFMTCYSESSFCFFTFLGHYYFMKANITRHSTTQISFFQWFRLSCMALLCWILATSTRSNGTFSTIFTLLVLCANIVQLWTIHLSLSKANYSKDGRIHHVFYETVKTIIKTSLKVAYNSLYMFFITLPVIIHDLRGYDFHCNMDHQEGNYNYYSNKIKPSWCSFAFDDDSTLGSEKNPDHYYKNTRFSLYQYVQRKYWNVGFLRYYQLKQIPNFLLAAPILLISFCGVFHWIFTSWKKFRSTMYSRNKQAAASDFQINQIFSWVFYALNKSVGVATVCQINEESLHCSSDDEFIGPVMLPYYAILAGLSVLGATFAHVQISTRLICSSSPALYWYLSYLYSSSNNCDKDSTKISQKYLSYYLMLFNLLGVILHVNWLPWT